MPFHRSATRASMVRPRRFERLAFRSGVWRSIQLSYGRKRALKNWGERRGSNPRHSEPQSDALPTELLPPHSIGPGRIAESPVSAPRDGRDRAVDLREMAALVSPEEGEPLIHVDRPEARMRGDDFLERPAVGLSHRMPKPLARARERGERLGKREHGLRVHEFRRDLLFAQ